MRMSVATSRLALLIAVLLIGPAGAGSFNWTGQGDNRSWEDAENWQPNDRFPGDGSEPDDEAAIARSAGTTAQVRLRRSVRLRRLDLGNGMRLEGGAITVTGSATWTDGELLTPVTVAPGARMTIEGSAEKRLSRAAADPLPVILNAGEVAIHGPGRLHMLFDSRIENTGRVVLHPGAWVLGNRCCLSPVSGIVGTGEIALEPGLLPIPGTRQAVLANLTVEAPRAVRIAPAHRLVLEGGTHVLTDGMPVQGGGVLALEHARAAVARIDVAADTMFELADRSALVGMVRLHGSGLYRWSGGGFEGDLLVGREARMAVVGDDRKSFGVPDGSRRGLLRNEGEIDWSGAGEIRLGSGPAGGVRIENAGTFRIRGEARLVASTCCTDPSRFFNTGRIEKLESAGDAVMSGVFLDNAGQAGIARGRLRIEGGARLEQSGGAMALAAETSIAARSVELRGGALQGHGRIEGTLNNAGGEIAPGGRGAVGVLGVTGDYAQGFRGVLRLEASGIGPGEADMLEVQGTARLNGERDVVILDGFRPEFGQRLEVMRYGGRRGTFARVSGLDLAPGLHLRARYDEAQPGGPGVLRLVALDQRSPSECSAPAQPLDWVGSRDAVAQILGQSDTAAAAVGSITRRFRVADEPTRSGADLGKIGRSSADPDNRNLVAFAFAWPELRSVFHLASVFIHEVGHGQDALRRGFTSAEAAPFVSAEQYRVLRRSGEETAFRLQATSLAEIADATPDFERCRAEILADDPRLQHLAADETALLRTEIAEDYPSAELQREWNEYARLPSEELEKLRDVAPKVEAMLRTREWRALEETWDSFP